VGDGDGDQVDAEPGPVASSTSDAMSGTRASSMLAFRSVQQGNHCAREEFLYELKAGLRAAACGGRPRAGNDATVTRNRPHPAVTVRSDPD
jgi:hypothetical protein